MNIDPLSPYLPLALLVATVVALLRGLLSTTVDGKTVSKLDGKAVVLPIVAVFSIGVVAWSQLHTGVVWSKVAMDAPIVFILAAGGATFLQRLKDRGALMLTGEVADMKASPEIVSASDIVAMMQAFQKAAGATTSSTSQTTITGTVEVKPSESAAMQEVLASQKAALEKMNAGLVNGTIKIVGKVDVANPKPPESDAVHVP